VSEVVFIGTSDAFGAGGRRQSAVLVRAPNGGILLDCGATTCSGLNEFDIARGEIDAVVISHFHGDHFGGIPALLLAALYEDARTAPLRIAGPPTVEARVRGLAEAMGYPLDEHDWTFPIQFEELPAGRELELGPVRLSAFETYHSPKAVPHGLIVRTGDARIAYSGDTGWFEELPTHVAGSDLFICECTYRSNPFEYHLNYDLLVKQSERFDCGRILLTHLGDEMTEHRGKVDFETADDGLRIRL
jgi:ribonuclease BN (tRNA processing enzyme)